MNTYKDGIDILADLSRLCHAQVRTTLAGEQWFHLETPDIPIVEDALKKIDNLSVHPMKNPFRFQYIDGETGMTLILDKGKNAYVSCLHRGEIW